MIKTYKSPSIYSTNVLLKAGRLHISFYALTNGGSYYETGNEEIQEALESNRYFGTDFYLANSREEVKAVEAAEEKAETPAALTQVNVTSLTEAKEYLAENFDYARSSLRTKASIIAAAKEHNIEFVGI